MTYTVKYNNKKETKELKDEYTVNNLLDEMKLSSQTALVKKNGETISEDALINDNDEIEIIKIIYGG